MTPALDSIFLLMAAVWWSPLAPMLLVGAQPCLGFRPARSLCQNLPGIFHVCSSSEQRGWKRPQGAEGDAPAELPMELAQSLVPSCCITAWREMWLLPPVRGNREDEAVIGLAGDLWHLHPWRFPELGNLPAWTRDLQSLLCSPGASLVSDSLVCKCYLYPSGSI